MQRWSEHFTAAFNHLPATTSTSRESESISAVPDPNMRTDEPTVDEVIRAIKKLKNGHADGIPPQTAEMCSRPCHSCLTLSIYPSLEIRHSPCRLARRHHNHSV